MAKSRDAFRTISEVSDALDTPAHVLRFWESKFNQIKPVKRAGGRRYYRPDDLALLASIKDLLHEQGLSIKVAQKHLREEGVKRIVAQGHALLDQGEAAPVAEPAKPAKTAPAMPEAVAAETPRPAPFPEEPEQIDLFGGMDLPVTAPRPVPEPAPKLQILSAKPVPDAEPSFLDPIIDPVAPETKAATAAPVATPEKRPLPAPPSPRDDVGPRVLAALAAADPAKLKAKAQQLAPIVERLTALRDELRHPW